jgi:hypothetical protein
MPVFCQPLRLHHSNLSIIFIYTPPNPMSILRLCLIIPALLLFSCEPAETFDPAAIPGEYEGSLLYYEADGSEQGDSRPDLSKQGGYKATVTRDGAEYLVEFDDSFTHLVPDVSVEMFAIIDGQTASLRTVSGQPYSSVSGSSSSPGQPPNYVSLDRSRRRVGFELLLKSNDADSVYFLNLSVFRFY